MPTQQEMDVCKLGGGVDSDHAGDVSHGKSVTGVVVKLAGGAVLYKTAYQQSLAHSSTELEFVAACDAGKYILYLRSLLGLDYHNMRQQCYTKIIKVHCSWRMHNNLQKELDIWI